MTNLSFALPLTHAESQQVNGTGGGGHVLIITVDITLRQWFSQPYAMKGWELIVL